MAAPGARRARRGARAVLGAAAVIVLAAGLGAPPPAGAAEVEVSASLEPRELAAGDLAELTLEARGGIFGHVRFRPDFALDNFAVVAGPMQAENLSVVNGATAHSFRLTWRLRALAAGPAEVRQISADFGGERVEIAPVGATVVAAPAGGRSWGAERRFVPRPGRDAKVFLSAEAAPLRPWTGQQVLYSLWIYTQIRVSSLSLDEAPSFPGCWVDEVAVADDADGETVEVGGELYLRKLLLRRALFPLHPGRLELMPSEVNLLVNSAGGNPFRPFFSRPERMSRKSDLVVVDVQPLPPLPPSPPALHAFADFDGLVGSVALTARLHPTDLEVGQAAALDLELAGGGHLEGARAPRLVVPAGLRVLPPAGGSSRSVRGTAVQGSRRWSYALVPERAGDFELPPVEIAYFDPEAGEYRLAASGPLALHARPAAEPSPASPALASGDDPAGTAPVPGTAPSAGTVDPAVHSIRSAALPAERGPQWRRLLPWLFAFPWGVALVVALVRRRHAPRPAGDGTATRFAERLEAARGEERARPAAVEIEGAWRELLAERWGIAAETSPARWPERLVAAGADPTAAAALAALVEDCHYLRYAPQLSATTDLRAGLIDASARLEPRLEPRLR